MARLPKEVLKSFFQTGNKPGGAHFASLIDSMLHYADRDLLGLKNYSSSQNYLAGDTVIYDGVIYQAIQPTTGNFMVQDWSRLMASSAASISDQGSGFGSDYELAESTGQSFMSNAGSFVAKLALNTAARHGRYRVQWEAVVNHQLDQGMGSFRLLNTGTGQAMGATLVHKQLSRQQKMHLGGFFLIDLDGTPNSLELQYQTMDDGMRQYIEQARIEIFKV